MLNKKQKIGSMSGIEKAKAMIFAAGFGTRLKPHTDFHPKALLKINGKSLLERNIDYLKSFGIKEFVINTHHFSGQIHLFLSRYRNSDINVHVSFEENGPFETGGGLAYASKFLQTSDQPFVVMNADILTNLNLGKMYEFNDSLVSMTAGERAIYYVYNFGGNMKLTEEEYQAILNAEKDLSDNAGVKWHSSPLAVLLRQQIEWAIIDEKLNS